MSLFIHCQGARRIEVKKIIMNGLELLMINIAFTVPLKKKKILKLFIS